MAKELGKYGIDVDLLVDEGIVHVKLFERDGDDRTVVDERKFRPEDYPEAIQARGCLYGFSKLYQDRTSSMSKDRNRLEGMDAVHERFMENHWEKEREASGPIVSAEIEALAILKSTSVGDVQKQLRVDYTEEQREKILNHPTVKAKAEEIRAARAESTASFDELLS